MVSDAALPRQSSKNVKVGVITVTHNSGRFFDTYMKALGAQTVPPDAVMLVDSGSPDPSYLDRADQYQLPVHVFHEGNVGFSLGNNMAWRRLRDFDYILFLNPDAFPQPDFLETAVAYMEQHPDVGMLTPTLLRYDIQHGKPLDIVDTTGVVRSWFGSSVERDQNQPSSVLVKYTGPNEVPWICAALALGRQTALQQVAENGDELFDEGFFMYKEDMDLTWRMRRAGWKNVHYPGLLAYHCRGWQDRKTIPRETRLLSIRNEMKMCVKNRSPFLLVACVKYLLVRVFDI